MLARAPVHDGGAEGDPALVERGPDEHPAVLEHGLAEAAVEVVELLLWHAGRTVAEADDVELDVGQALEVVGLVHDAADPLRQVEMALDHRLVPQCAASGRLKPRSSDIRMGPSCRRPGARSAPASLLLRRQGSSGPGAIEFMR